MATLSPNRTHSATRSTPSSRRHNGRMESVVPGNGKQPIRVLDLFAGLGGLASGFARAGFSVTGVDDVEETKTIVRLNGIGRALARDLGASLVVQRVPVLIGGPPCRPWSIVNLTRRKHKHPDRRLMGRFFKHVLSIKPKIFLMENVPSVKNDGSYKFWTRAVAKAGYSLASQTVMYSDYGAATSRRRLITVGIRTKSLPLGADEFFQALKRFRRKPTTVRKAIAWARKLDRGAYRDHEWSNLTTIDNYREYYRTNKYGWYQLDYSKPAPSFGNILKTYILHPEAGRNGFAQRVLSVREALCIMGFKKGFKLPEDLSMTKKYQMVADAVSPVVSFACARAVRSLLSNHVPRRSPNGS